MDRSITMQAALGTSLATIVFTALSSVLAHHRRSAVRWAIVRRIAPGIVIGGLLGAAIADVLSSRTLQIMFVVFMFAIAVQFGFGILAATASRALPGPMGMSLAGTAIGAASSLFGVGGGSMSVPFMTWCSVPVRQAIATSAAIGLPDRAECDRGLRRCRLERSAPAALERRLRCAAGVHRHRGREYFGGTPWGAVGASAFGNHLAAHLRAVCRHSRRADVVGVIIMTRRNPQSRPILRMDERNRSRASDSSRDPRFDPLGDERSEWGYYYRNRHRLPRGHYRMS